jgi:hypothetical protein
MNEYCPDKAAMFEMPKYPHGLGPRIKSVTAFADLAEANMYVSSTQASSERVLKGSTKNNFKQTVI